jgi:hypothetical protein
LVKSDRRRHLGNRPRKRNARGPRRRETIRDPINPHISCIIPLTRFRQRDIVPIWHISALRSSREELNEDTTRQGVVTQFEIYHHPCASWNLVKSMTSKNAAFAGTRKMSHYPPGPWLDRSSPIWYTSGMVYQSPAVQDLRETLRDRHGTTRPCAVFLCASEHAWRHSLQNPMSGGSFYGAWDRQVV